MENQQQQHKILGRETDRELREVWVPGITWHCDSEAILQPSFEPKCSHTRYSSLVCWFIIFVPFQDAILDSVLVKLQSFLLINYILYNIQFWFSFWFYWLTRGLCGKHCFVMLWSQGSNISWSFIYELTLGNQNGVLQVGRRWVIVVHLIADKHNEPLKTMNNAMVKQNKPQSAHRALVLFLSVFLWVVCAGRRVHSKVSQLRNHPLKISCT